MTDGKKVLVTGAGGALGHSLVLELARRGYEVRAAVSKSGEGDLPREVEVVRGDLTEAGFVTEAVRDAVCIFHFAARLHLNDPTQAQKDQIRRTNIGATKLLLERSECERFIFAGTINVYGAGDGRKVFDEKSPSKPAGAYAESKLAAEKLVLCRPGSTVLRFAAIYGPRMKGNYLRLAKLLRKGRFLYTGSGLNRRTLIYEQDAVRAAVLCSESEAAKARTYNVTDGSIYTLQDIVAAISSALGKEPPTLKIPGSLARGAAAGFDLALKTIGSDRRFGPLLEKINEDLAVSGRLIREELGFESKCGLADGWKEVVSSRAL